MTMQDSSWWFVFVKGRNHLVVAEAYVDVAAITAAGFELVWDSAPSEFEGAQYAARHYDAPVPVAKTVTP